MPMVGICQGAKWLIVSWDRNVGFATREGDTGCADGLGRLDAPRSHAESELTRVMISMNRQKTNPMVKRTAMANEWSAIPRGGRVVGRPGGAAQFAVLVGFKVSRETELRERKHGEEEGSSLAVQDDEQVGYSGRAVAQLARASGQEQEDKKWCLSTERAWE